MERQIPPLSIRDAGEKYECDTVAELRQHFMPQHGWACGGQDRRVLGKLLRDKRSRYGQEI
jgi:hypothetical protein